MTYSLTISAKACKFAINFHRKNIELLLNILIKSRWDNRFFRVSTEGGTPTIRSVFQQFIKFPVIEILNAPCFFGKWSRNLASKIKNELDFIFHCKRF